MKNNTKKQKSLPWDEVESAIRKEIAWLKDTIIPSPFEKGFCPNCIYRQIATFLKTMEGQDILLVLDSNHVVEFSIIDADVKSKLFK